MARLQTLAVLDVDKGQVHIYKVDFTKVNQNKQQLSEAIEKFVRSRHKTSYYILGKIGPFMYNHPGVNILSTEIANGVQQQAA